MHPPKTAGVGRSILSREQVRGGLVLGRESAYAA